LFSGKTARFAPDQPTLGTGAPSINVWSSAISSVKKGR